MDKLNQSAINDVLQTDPIIRAEVLFKFLVEGKSHRQIERERPELIRNDGWSSWKIVQFFGFGDNDKGRYSNLNIQNVISQLQDQDVELNDFAEYHTENNILGSEKNYNDGTDILRNIKSRVGQAKLRKIVLTNYQTKCALCDIDSKDLLVASHIKHWSKSLQNERIDPTNTILLCKLHDGLFENGHLSFEDTLTIIFKDANRLIEQGILTTLTFRNPTQEPPNIIYLKNHRDKHKL
jgi:predicted restriction endonuclease